MIEVPVNGIRFVRLKCKQPLQDGQGIPLGLILPDVFIRIYVVVSCKLYAHIPVNCAKNRVK